VRLLGVLAATFVLTFTVTNSAAASVLDAIVVAHRGASIPGVIPEGTPKAYSYAVYHGADWLDSDVRWTKDSNDADTVGTMVLLHNRRFDDLYNCTTSRAKPWYVDQWLWSDIYNRCRTKIANQRMWRLVDLLPYAKGYGKKINVEIKPSSITWDQARQLYAAIRNYDVRVVAFHPAAEVAGSPINKIRSLDFADTAHRLQYGLISHGYPTWPSVTQVKTFGNTVDVRLDIPSSVAKLYRDNGIRLNVWTLKTETDYAKAAKLLPYAVTVDDPARWNRWVESQT